jgi:hypothetical protein
VPLEGGARRARRRRTRTVHSSDEPFEATPGARERRARREPPYPLLRCARAEKKKRPASRAASIFPGRTRTWPRGRRRRRGRARSCARQRPWRPRGSGTGQQR